MSKVSQITKRLLVSCLASAALLALPQAGAAKSFNVLVKFTPDHGRNPSGAVVADAAGNLYGVTSNGGSTNCKHGCGVVYRVTSDGVLSTLYVFQGGGDGYAPAGSLLIDASGNLYGTTTRGGEFSSGSVFMLAPDGTKTILHSFGAFESDGLFPEAGLARDDAGNFYGTTMNGGAFGSHGSIFKISADGKESILYSFCAAQNCTDGAEPTARLLIDKHRTLYGTAGHGGPSDVGTAFSLVKDGSYAVLHAFGSSENDGQNPSAGLVTDRARNLYGTTALGGANNEGTIFRIAPDGTETILHEFNGGDGALPDSELLLDRHGNLFGTASTATAAAGTAFRLAFDGADYTVLHTFRGGRNDGANPAGGLTNFDGLLVGATQHGGRSCNKLVNGCGVVFSLKPQ